MSEKLKNIVKRYIYLAHQSTTIFDKVKLNKNLKLKWAPIFIIGVPRSGTTLLYQLLINSLKFAYIPNIANHFYMCPITATKCGKKFCKEYRSSFSSKYGFEKGCMSPSEAGNIWNRWFPHEKWEGFNYTPVGYLSAKARRDFYSIVAHHERIFDAPFLTKNVKWSVRLPVLKEVFQNIKLIHVKRDPVDSALSLLQIRRKLGVNWWSVIPKEVNQITKLTDIEQVAYQVYYVEKDIWDDIKLYGFNQVHTVIYKDLCENTQDELDKIFQFIFDKNFSNNDFQYPVNIKRSKPAVNKWIKTSEIKNIEKILTGFDNISHE